jgi:hypothetical protein
MTAAPSAIDPAPWPAASYARAFNQHCRTTYTATYGGVTIPLWNITLTIDETSSPTARLEADTTAAVAAAMAVRAVSSYDNGALALTTGYDDLAQSRIFYGAIAEAEDRHDGTGHIAACSWDWINDVPPLPVSEGGSSLPWTVPSTYTTLAQAQAAIVDRHSDWSPVYGMRTVTLGSLTAPSSYTSFRQQQLDKTDTLLDFNIACANALGQWLRGDQRGRATSGFLSGDTTQTGRPSDTILSDRWDSGTPIVLTPITETWKRRRSTDDYAEQLIITASYKSGGSTVQKVATYAASDGAIWAPLTRAISVDYRAQGSAFTSGTDPVAKSWATSYAARTWRLTATCRAVWWLEPGQRATIGPHTGTITKLTFNIDQGTMTIDLRPTVEWAP